jgi:hypothetical protein
MAPPIKQLQAAASVVKSSNGGRARPPLACVIAAAPTSSCCALGVEAIAQRLNTTPSRVSQWSRGFETCGLDGLADKSGRGRKPSIPAAKVARVITEATRPPKGKRRWSIRSMSVTAAFQPVRCSVSGPGTT